MNPLVRKLVNVLAALLALASVVSAATATAAPITVNGATVLRTYVINGHTGPAPILSLDAGYGMVAWSAVRRIHGSIVYFTNVATADGKKLDGVPYWGEVERVVRVKPPGATNGVWVIEGYCQKVDCDYHAVNPTTHQIWTPTTYPNWLNTVVEQYPVQTGAWDVEDETLAHVATRVAGTTSCPVALTSLDTVTVKRTLPAIPACLEPERVALRGSLLVATVRVPHPVGESYRDQVMVLNLAAASPAWETLATGTSSPAGDLSVDTISVTPTSVTLIETPYSAPRESGYLGDRLPSRLMRWTFPAGAGDLLASTVPDLLPLGRTLATQAGSFVGDGTNLYAERLRPRSRHGTGPRAIQLLRLAG